MYKITIILLFLAISISFIGCSPKIGQTVSTDTKTTVVKSYRDSAILVKEDSANIVRDLSKGLTQPQKDVVNALDMPSDTIKQGNFEVITSIHKGKELIKVKDLPHTQLVKGLNTTIERDSTTKVTRTIEVKQSAWERFKSHIRFIELLAVIGGALFLCWHFRKEILAMFGI